jgi:hypothetical protein
MIKKEYYLRLKDGMYTAFKMGCTLEILRNRLKKKGGMIIDNAGEKILIPSSAIIYIEEI